MLFFAYNPQCPAPVSYYLTRTFLLIPKCFDSLRSLLHMFLLRYHSVDHTLCFVNLMHVHNIDFIISQGKVPHVCFSLHASIIIQALMKSLYLWICGFYLWIQGGGDDDARCARASFRKRMPVSQSPRQSSILLQTETAATPDSSRNLGVELDTHELLPLWMVKTSGHSKTPNF